jgi:hypothetical protein
LRTRIFEASVAIVACLLGAGALSACKEEAGPRSDVELDGGCLPDAAVVMQVELAEFCDESEARRALCERYESYDRGVADALGDCAQTGFPVAVGACDQQVIQRRGGLSDTAYYFDAETGELEGIRMVEDRGPMCGPNVEAGEVDSSCNDLCFLCGATDRNDLCGGDLVEPYVQHCLDTFELVAPECKQCACTNCFAFAYGDLALSAMPFHECVTEHCASCAGPGPDGGVDPGDEDAGL